MEQPGEPESAEYDGEWRSPGRGRKGTGKEKGRGEGEGGLPESRMRPAEPVVEECLLDAGLEAELDISVGCRGEDKTQAMISH
jgi:hypothetical protein